MGDGWTKSEKKIARKAFDTAYQRECAAIIASVQQQAAEMKTPQELWKLENYLYVQRRDTDEKYDYRYSVLFMTFDWLLREGWLTFDDLVGLSQEKLDHLHHMQAVSKRFEQIVAEMKENPDGDIDDDIDDEMYDEVDDDF